MLFLIVSVFCSVIVSVMLKLARKNQVNITQLIGWNYLAATVLTFLFFKPSLAGFRQNADQLPWSIYLLLAFLLPGIFLALGRSIIYTGLVKTEVAQRLSLFIPLIAAFVLFGEQLNSGVLLGVFIGLLGIVLLIGWNKSNTDSLTNESPAYAKWFFPLLVFFGYGIIDVFFKQIAQVTYIPYTSSMFIVFFLAMILSFLYFVGIWFFGKIKLQGNAVIWGLALGIFNFCNILFYMKAHVAIPDNPSIVFVGMNIGVIVLGTLTGVLFFKERLTVMNRFGLVLAMVAVLVISKYS